jgi:WhiB family redox-sensing transcriptional regulator
VALLFSVFTPYGVPMTLRQIERKYIELQEAIRNNDGVQCASVPEVFFPEDEHDLEIRKSMVKVAKEVCADCPVRLMCFDYALSAGMHGIWGGTTYEERQKLRTL